MKHILITLMIAGGITTAAQAQSEQYNEAMQAQVSLLDSAVTYTSPAAVQQVANTFERIAAAEQTQWLPYYYAAYCHINAAYMTKDKEKIDELADKALLNAEKAQTLKGENSEIKCILSMILSARIGVDPMNRGAKLGPQSGQLLEEAKKLDPENPRVYMLMGQALVYTPEAFGGSKVKGKQLLEQSVEKFGTFKPETPIAPHWGLEYTKGVIAALK